MGRNTWVQFPQAWRESIINLFKLQGVDFEKTFITDDEGSEKKAGEASPWITRQEAAAYAGIGTDTIDNWKKAGYIKYIKLADGRPGAVRIDRKSLSRYLNTKVKADPEKRTRKVYMKGSSYRVN